MDRSSVISAFVHLPFPFLPPLSLSLSLSLPPPLSPPSLSLPLSPSPPSLLPLAVYFVAMANKDDEYDFLFKGTYACTPSAPWCVGGERGVMRDGERGMREEGEGDGGGGGGGGGGVKRLGRRRWWR